MWLPENIGRSNTARVNACGCMKQQGLTLVASTNTSSVVVNRNTDC